MKLRRRIVFFAVMMFLIAEITPALAAPRGRLIGSIAGPKRVSSKVVMSAPKPIPVTRAFTPAATQTTKTTTKVASNVKLTTGRSTRRQLPKNNTTAIKTELKTEPVPATSAGLKEVAGKQTAAIERAKKTITSKSPPAVKKEAGAAIDKATKDAAAKTARSKTTVEIRKSNLKKGLPESRLGGSGKPKRHVVENSTRKKAKEGAAREGKGRPLKHPSDENQPPHFHATDNSGKKIGKQSPHFTYPRSRK